MPRRILFNLLFAFFHSGVFGQNLYIENFTQKEYGSSNYSTSPQNWCIEQDSLGRIYIANSSGVLLFDGLTMKMIPGTENVVGVDEILEALADTPVGDTALIVDVHEDDGEEVQVFIG